jgi:hypothetical protein
VAYVSYFDKSHNLLPITPFVPFLLLHHMFRNEVGGNSLF